MMPADTIPSQSTDSLHTIPSEAHKDSVVNAVKPALDSQNATSTIPVFTRPATSPALPTSESLLPLWVVTPDSIASRNDSVAVKALDKTYGVVIDAPEVPTVEAHNSYNWGMSTILAGLFLLFCIIGLRFRNNSKYIGALMRNLVEVRLRSNVFDETVRETSFIVLLNLLWSCSAGIVLCALLDYTLPDNPAFSFGLTALTTKPAASTALCMGVMILYTCGMALAYLTVGTVFSDKVHATMWLKGFTASQGLLGWVFFPIALLLLFYPHWYEELLWIALISFLIAKFVFIWKGFRIFFTQFSSWVLFLYYLCSLEIVPLILTYWAACQLCSLL